MPGRGQHVRRGPAGFGNGMASFNRNAALLANLVGWYRADQGITLGATLAASGTTPPAVTISGSAATTPGLYLQIDGAGTLGVATFKASADNGVTFFATGVLTAASVPLTGALAGITAAFSAGTYATDNVYQGTVSAWADISGAGHHLLQASASAQPLFIISGTKGQPTVRLDGANDFMKTGAFTFNTGRTIVMAYRNNAIAVGAHDIIADGLNLTDAYIQNVPTSLNLQSAVNYAGAVANSVFVAFVSVWNGASSRISVNRSQIAAGTVSTNAGGFTLGGFADGTRNAAIEVAELALYSSPYSDAQLTSYVGALQALYV